MKSLAEAVEESGLPGAGPAVGAGLARQAGLVVGARPAVGPRPAEQAGVFGQVRCARPSRPDCLSRPSRPDCPVRPVRVLRDHAQYAPREATTAWMVRARMARSWSGDQLSM